MHNFTCIYTQRVCHSHITNKKYMSLHRESRTTLMATTVAFLLIFLIIPKSQSTSSIYIPDSDVDLLEFPLNLEFLEAEFFLFGALGYGLDKVAPNLTKGGPPPIGTKKANLDALTRDLILQFGWQEVGHLRAIQNTVKGFPRPLLNLSSSSFAKVMDAAFGRTLRPPFDPYANSINFLLASYLVPYVGLTGYVGANPKLKGATSKRLVAGLLGVESGQDAVIRALLYERAMTKVKPYGITVAEFTNQISNLRTQLGHGGLKDEGLVVLPILGAEGRVAGNVLAGDQYSLSYGRTPEEILRIVYGGNGDEHVAGGFYPKGANGHIARSYLAPIP
ncbi:desiccation-related protein PCC13-62-like [Humulus lupulus]|uniref:desiccation-related protein PCC13-62-like n=1 Tax=Humulus lupulus TaxID=3486 RepID=UPI002B41766E|nr:desiccation-related protein PCC13-62-like [Humulus lupulus]